MGGKERKGSVSPRLKVTLLISGIPQKRKDYFKAKVEKICKAPTEAAAASTSNALTVHHAVVHRTQVEVERLADRMGEL